MDLDNIKKHWTELAIKFQQDLNATTKTGSIKKLEIMALYGAMKNFSFSKAEVLEVGCGNGLNCFALAENLKEFNFTGVDYVSEMINSANSHRDKEGSISKNLSFYEGDILKLVENPNLKKEYDIVFTDRCIINLNSSELQETGIRNIIKKVKLGGYLIIIENMQESHSRQNNCRESVGLPKREAPPYNLFLNESNLISLVSKSMKLKETSDFGSLHDLLLYVLVPMTNGGLVDYNHPIVQAATDFLIKSSEIYNNSFGNFGQNRLYLFHKE